jgi:UDP-glucuronate decarboxylase
MDPWHNPKGRGSNPCPATRKIKGFAEPAAPFFARADEEGSGGLEGKKRHHDAKPMLGKDVSSLVGWENTMKEQRVLVTGGAGFLGSYLCKRLVETGAEVLCLDNFFTGSKRNIRDLIDRKNFEVIRHDLVEPIFLEVDQIYNLACPASPVHYQYNPVKTVKTNVMGTINMLGLAKRVKARVLQASTSEVYGNPQQHPQRETYWGHVNPIGLRSCYDEGKRVAETLMMDYHRQNEVDIKIVRIFNTYGPRMAVSDGRVVSNFIVQALRNDPITIYGNGNQTRSFCYVSDMVEGLVRMMKCDHFTGPVNLGNPREFSIAQLAELVLQITRSESEIVYRPLPEDDPIQRCPDITLAKKNLDWEPVVPLREGLEKTIEYFRQVI